MADDDFLSTYGQSLNEANQSAADLQRLALQNMKSGSPGRMLLGAGQDVLAPAMGVMSPVTAGLDVARKALAYRFGEPVGNAFDVASAVGGGPEDIANALRLAGKVSPVAAMAALPRRSGSLEEAVARAEARSRGEIPPNPASSVSQTDLGSLGPTPASNLSVGMGHNKPTTTTTLQELADQAGMTPREYGSRFSKILSKTPYEEWSYTHQPYRDMQERKIFDPQSMKTGDVIIPFFGDLTSAGRRITDINSNRLHFPTDTEGGEGYMRMTPDIWASGQSIVSGLANKAGAAVEEAKKLGYENPDVYGVHVGMGPRSGDFSIHTAKALLGMLDPSKISASDAQKFNDFMREQQISSAGKEVYKPFEDFPGLYSDELHNYLMKQGQGDARIKFSKGMDTSELLKRGFPDVGAARFATTEPLLGGLPTYSTGMSIGKLNMENPVSKSPAVPVGSYPVSMPGTYVGGFETPVYKDEVFRDFANAYKLRTPNATAPAKYKAYAGNTAYQIVDPELKDSLSEAMELAKRGRADGGEINDDITHALRLALGERKHFDDGGDVRGGDNPGGLSGDTGAYSSGNVGESQGAMNAATAAALDARQGMNVINDTFGPARGDSVSNTSNDEMAPAPANILGRSQGPGGQLIGLLSSDQPASTPDVPSYSFNPMTAPTAIMGVPPAAQGLGRIFGDITGNTFSDLTPLNANTIADPNNPLSYSVGTAPIEEVAKPLAAFEPSPNAALRATRDAIVQNLGEPTVSAPTAVAQKSFEPSHAAALRAARDAIAQNLGEPEPTDPVAVAQKPSDLKISTPVDLPASKPAPLVDKTLTADEAQTIPVNALEDPALIAAYNAQYGLTGPKNAYADMTLGQRIPNVTTNNPFINAAQGLSNFLTDRFVPSYNLGSDQYNKISQTPDTPSDTSGNRGNRGEPIIPIETAVAPVAATPVAAPVVPGTPVPYTYAKRTPYLDYGAYGAGIGNVKPISYRDPINWALVPGYRATGGRVGENNAIANVLRMLAQNRS